MNKLYRVIAQNWDTGQELEDLLNDQVNEGYVFDRNEGGCMVFYYDEELHHEIMCSSPETSAYKG